jgi:hypothetical protein
MRDSRIDFVLNIETRRTTTCLDKLCESWASEKMRSNDAVARGRDKAPRCASLLRDPTRGVPVARDAVDTQCADEAAGRSAMVSMDLCVAPESPVKVLMDFCIAPGSFTKVLMDFCIASGSPARVTTDLCVAPGSPALVSTDPSEGHSRRRRQPRPAVVDELERTSRCQSTHQQLPNELHMRDRAALQPSLG